MSDNDGSATPRSSKGNYELTTLSENELKTTNDLQTAHVQVPTAVAAVQGEGPKRPTAKRDTRFWMCFVAIMLATILIAMDIGGGVAVALPIIVKDLNGVEFEWIGSAYALSATALLPLSGGLAQVFGRRLTLLAEIFIFAVGSAVCGAAPNMNILILGRVLQGVGAGGIVSLTQIVIADLVPLHERGAYNGLIAIAYVLGTVGSPVIGGALAQGGNWRWYFYLNIPLCGVTAVIVAYFLKLKTPKGSFKEKILMLDWIGNFMVMGGTTAIILGLTWGGFVAPWSSARVLVPVILGFIGLGLFIVYESFRPRNPLVPIGVLSNWTSVSGYIQSGCGSFCTLGLIYYLAVYYEAVELASPVGTGVDTFASSGILMPFGIIAGISITKTGKYKPQLAASWVCIIVGSALLSTVGLNTPRSRVLGYQALYSIGLGPLVTSLVFPILAPLPVSLNASALAFYAFARYFLQIFGITVGGAVLQNELTKRLPANFTSQFSSGTAIAYQVIPLIKGLDDPLRDEVRNAFGESLRFVWIVTCAIAAVGFVCSVTVKSIPLSSTMDEQWGLEEAEQQEINRA